MGLLWEGHAPTVAAQLEDFDTRLAAVAVAIASDDPQGTDAAARNVEEWLDNLDAAEIGQILIWSRWPRAAEQGENLLAGMDGFLDGLGDADLRPVRED